jgi:hypothetical protein
MNCLPKLTPNERKEIYLELAENYAKGLGCENFTDKIFQLYKSYFICNSLRKKFGLLSFKNIYPFFPELAYFEPLETDVKGKDCEGGWFSVYQKHGFEERIMTLLFCAEMCDEDLEISK